MSGGAGQGSRVAGPARTVAIGLAACLAGAGAIGIAYGARDAAITLGMLLAVSLVVLGAAHLLAAHRTRAGRLARQSRLAVLLVVGTVLAMVWIGAWKMFVSEHDAVVVSVMTAAIGLIAVRVGDVLARGVIADARALRDGLEAVGEGRRDVEITVGGRDELAEVAASANAMVARLAAEERGRAEADAARRRLVAAVSHDIRTPLASLRLLVESIEDGVATGETRDRYVRQIHSHVNVLSGLVDDLFELSRIEAGDIAWTMSQIELRSLVGDTVEAMRAQAENRGVAMRCELDGEECVARANPEKLQRVLFNLIQNAIRHTPADGTVTVRARRLVPDEIELEVADSGDGIPADDRDHIFEPFFRGGPDPSRSTEGAGLGLAVARAIVEAHGGRIWLEPSSTGTQMRFTLRSAMVG